MTYQNVLNLNVAKNVFGVRKRAGGTLSIADLQIIAGAMVGWEDTVAQPGRSNGVRMTEIYVRALDEQNAPVWIQSINPPLVGGQASPALPFNVTLAVKFTTGFAGRSFRGRHYWIGLAEGQVTGDFVISTAADNIRGFLDTLRTQDLDAIGYDLVILSRQHNGVPRVTGVATTVTGVSLTDYRVDTQRRRLVGEGQ